MTMTDFLSWMLGAILCLAGLAKIVRRQTFADSLQVFGLGPGLVRHGLATLVPAIELALGLAITLRWFPEAPSVVALLFVGFAGLLLYARLRTGPGQEASCGCTGRLRPIRWTSVAFNGVCALAALWVARGV